MTIKQFNALVRFSYKGKVGKVVSTGNSGMVTFSLGGEEFGPKFYPKSEKVELAIEWLRQTGHDVMP